MQSTTADIYQKGKQKLNASAGFLCGGLENCDSKLVGLPVIPFRGHSPNGKVKSSSEWVFGFTSYLATSP